MVHQPVLRVRFDAATGGVGARRENPFAAVESPEVLPLSITAFRALALAHAVNLTGEFSSAAALAL